MPASQFTMKQLIEIGDLKIALRNIDIKLIKNTERIQENCHQILALSKDINFIRERFEKLIEN